MVETTEIRKTRTCAFCGETSQDVLPGYPAHVGGVGDYVEQPPACENIVACLLRQSAKQCQ